MITSKCLKGENHAGNFFFTCKVLPLCFYLKHSNGAFLLKRINMLNKKHKVMTSKQAFF